MSPSMEKIAGVPFTPSFCPITYCLETGCESQKDKSKFLLFFNLEMLPFGSSEHHAPTILVKADVPNPDLGYAA